MSDTAPNLRSMIAKLRRRSALGTAECDALLSLPHRIVDIEKARYVMREGEEVGHCALLLSGFASCCRFTSEGSRQILSIHMAGNLMHLQSGPDDAAISTVQALTRLQLALILRRDLFELATEYPQIAAALWADSGANASILSEWLVRVGRRNARSRVAHLICEMAVRQRTCGVVAGADEYAWPITQEQLGDAAGLTSVHVNRTLHGLRREALLNISHQRIRILDWDGLCDAGDFTPAYLHFRQPGEAMPEMAYADQKG